MEIIKDIAAIIGCILSFISLVTVCTKGGRAAVKRFFNNNTKEIVEENAKQTNDIHDIKESLAQLATNFGSVQEVLEQQCRNTIKNIYYKYQHDKKIPLYERKTVDKTWDIYHNKFHQNSYVGLLYNEICKWEIDVVSYQNLEEDD